MPEQLELFINEPFSLRLTIGDALRIFWDNYWSHLPSAKATRTHFERIKMFFNKYYLDTISKADVERFRRHLKDMGYADASINKHHMILSRVFTKFAEYQEGGFVNGEDFRRIRLPRRNPAAQVPKAREKPRDYCITLHQKKILCSYSDEDLCEIIDTLFWSELREGDLFRMTDANVDTAKWIMHGIQGKSINSKNPGGNPYRVPIPESRRDMVMRRLKTRKPGTPIFKTKNLQKRWARVRVLASRVDPYLLKVQLRDMKPSANSHLLDSGVDVETAQKKGNWKDRRMVTYYDKRPDTRVREAAEILAK